ncbi:MAG: ABC transporter ATP-binding protein [Oscillospiraceae bacterium]|nr:ABC transporter ATP-binding protein [Oscillospiraceae bacterium]
MNALEVEKLSFSYGKEPVLQQISFGVAPGELCILIGANGCGKSTLLDCALGYLRPDEGTVRVQGVDTTTLSERQLARKIAYVPQASEPSFPYTVEQIVLMGRTASLDGFARPGKADMELAQEALRAVGMSHLADRPYTQVSGGELQLVLLARALVQQTDIIFMDEPTAHLDFRNELLFLERVNALLTGGNTTVVMATHAPNQAFYYESRGVPVTVCAMAHGNIRYRGTPTQVLTRERLEDIYGVEVMRLTHATQYGVTHQIIPVQTVGGKP